MYYKTFRLDGRANKINIILADQIGNKYSISINEEDNIFTLFQKYINLTGKYNENFYLLYNEKNWIQYLS